MRIDNQIKKTKEVLNKGRISSGKVVAETSRLAYIRKSISYFRITQRIKKERQIRIRTRMKSYKLVNNIPVKCELGEIDLSDKTLWYDDFTGVQVSTVFLVWDHSFGNDKQPVLFETMVFGGKYDEYQIRYNTYEEAELGHKEISYMVNKISLDRQEKLDDLGI